MLLESAAAILAAPRIAVAPRVARLQLGEADLAADLGVTPGPDESEPLWARPRSSRRSSPPHPQSSNRARTLPSGYEAASAAAPAVFVGDDGRLVDEAVIRAARAHARGAVRISRRSLLQYAADLMAADAGSREDEPVPYDYDRPPAKINARLIGAGLRLVRETVELGYERVVRWVLSWLMAKSPGWGSSARSRPTRRLSLARMPSMVFLLVVGYPCGVP